MAGERLNNIPIITRETEQFPAGGSCVRIGEDVHVIPGDIADLSGRGVVISNGTEEDVKPVKVSQLAEAWVDIMNA